MSFSIRIENIIASYVHQDLPGAIYNGIPLVRGPIDAFFKNTDTVNGYIEDNIGPKSVEIDQLSKKIRKEKIKNPDRDEKTVKRIVTRRKANKLGKHLLSKKEIESIMLPREINTSSPMSRGALRPAPLSEEDLLSLNFVVDAPVPALKDNGPASPILSPTGDGFSVEELPLS